MPRVWTRPELWIWRALRRPTKNPQNRSLLPVPFRCVPMSRIDIHSSIKIKVRYKVRSAQQTLMGTDVDPLHIASEGLTEQRVVLQDRFQVDLILEDLIVRFEPLEVLYAWLLHTSTQV
jgi:hypothetical protein